MVSSLASYFTIIITMYSTVASYDQGQVDDTRALIYLMEYGYVESAKWSSSLVTQDTLKEFVTTAVRDFQAFAGLNQTGELDLDTKNLMRTPRCGVRDIIGHGATTWRRKRWGTQ